ncbi:MAG: tRNA (adenosine(37)-N6)-threonylcarbamoyltransferase complex transferase subunit TsaD, partial [Lachnospiraceae bacterium]|nr:tRNA (adenosine(37)-N6)-threonylcarbamoyltransferase complex transferase subunit TsaD [Lachnospiraceae bacterium]
VTDSEYDFSFSGLKSAVLNYLNKERMAGRDIVVEDVAASFQRAVTDVLTEHGIRAVIERKEDKIALAGGVASNSALRSSFEKACEENCIKLYYPSPVYCTDNAAMIGVAGYYEYIRGVRSGLDLNAVPNLKLGER